MSEASILGLRAGVGPQLCGGRVIWLLRIGIFYFDATSSLRYAAGPNEARGPSGLGAPFPFIFS